MTKKGRKKLASRILSFALSIILVGTTFYGDYRVAYADEITVEEAAETPAEVSTEAPVQTEPAQQEVVEATSSDVTVPTEVSEESVVSDESVVSGETVETVVSETISDETAETVETEETLETETEETETETETEETEEEPLEFNQSVTVNGILISLYAKPGVLPNDAKLQVSALPQKEEEAIKEAIDEETVKDVEKTYSFDINIYSAEKGGFVQPKDGTVSVTFDAIPEGNSKDTTVEVFHVENNGTDVQKVESVSNESKTDEITFGAKHFSVYTVTLYKKGFKNYTYNFAIDTYDIDSYESIGSGVNVPIEVQNYGNYRTPAQIAPQIAGYKFVKAVEGFYGDWGNTITYFTVRDGGRGSYDYAEYTTKSNPGKYDWHDVYEDDIYFLYEADTLKQNAKFVNTQFVDIANTVTSIDFSRKGVLEVYSPEDILAQMTAPSGYKFLMTVKNDSSKTGYVKVQGFRLNYKDANQTSYKLQYTTDGTSWLDWGTNVIYMMCRPTTADATDYHLDLGFTKADYEKYQNGGAKVKVVLNGQTYDMTAKGEDKVIGTYEYRKSFTKSIKATDSIVYQVIYKGKTYEMTCDVATNNEAFERCFTTHYGIQKKFGFDYVFTFTQDFELAGDVVYHKFDTISDDDYSDKLNWSSQNSNETKSYKVKTYQETVKEYPGHTFIKWVNKDGKEFKAGDSIPVKNGDKVDLYAVWSENEIPVAVYATDGTKNVRVNPALKEKLGLNYIQNDGYYPIGVVMIPETLVAGKKSPYLNSQADFDALKPYLTKIDTSKLTGGKNSGNTVASNLNYVQLDYGKGGNQSFTAFFDWNMAEYGSKNGEGGVFADGRTANGVSINNPQGGNFKYHIDLRFDTHVVTYKGSYYTNNSFDQTKDLTEIAYFTGTSVTKEMAQAVAAEYVNGYTVEGLYTDENLTQKFDGISSLTANYTIYVKYTKITNFTVTYKDGYTGGGEGKILSSTSVAYGSPTPAQTAPTRDYYVFKGWTPQVASTVTDNATYVATWEKQYKDTVTISAVTKSKTYDGEALTADYVRPVTNLPEGFEVTDVTYTGTTTITNAGTANYSISSYKIVDKENNDFTDYFTVNLQQNGTLTINPINVTIGTGTGSWNFDGKFHSEPTIKVKVNDAVQTLNADPKATYKTGVKEEAFVLYTTSSRMFKGEEPNKYAIEYTGGAKEENYNITDDLGKLIIAGNNGEVTITAKSANKTYDGEPLTESECDVAGLDTSLFTVEATATGTITEVGSTNNVVSDYKIYNAKKEDVTDQFTKITTKNGTLSVSKRAITVKSGSEKRAYNGQPLQNTDVTIVAGELAPNQKLSDLVERFSNFASITKVGKVENTYSHSETDLAKKNYTITYQNGELEITKNTTKVEIVAPSASKVYDGTALDADAVLAMDGKKVTVKGLVAGDTADVTLVGSVTDVAEGVDALEITKVVIKNAAGEDVTSSYETIEKTNGEISITARKYSVTTEGGEKEYDGTALTNAKYTLTGIVDAEKNLVSVKTTGSQTIVGHSDNTYEMVWNGVTSSNYVLDKATLGVLKVNGNDDAITITAKDATKVYDASALTEKEYTVKGIDTTKFTVTATTSGTLTDVGTEANVISSYQIVDVATQKDVTEYFTNVSKENGTLTVTKRKVTLTSATDSKAYDGTPLTNDTVTESWPESQKYGFVAGEGATFDVTGTVTFVSEGKVDNTFTYTLNDNTKAGNYEITPVFGKLSITAPTQLYGITVTANSGGEKYNGKEQSVSGFTNANLTYTLNGRNYVVSGIEASAEATNAGTYTVEVTGTPKVETAEGNKMVDVTNMFTVTKVPGTLTIGKRTVVMTSATGTKEYDGDPLTAQWLVDNDESVTEKVTETGDGFVDDEGATYLVTGSQLVEGSSADAFTYTLNEGTLAANYDITTVEGTLTVTNRNAKYEITVKANSLETFYNGEDQTAEGFETLTFKTKDNHTYTVSGLTASATAKDVLKVDGKVQARPVSVLGTPVVKDDQGNDVTNQFKVKTENGTLTIKPRSVTLQSASAEKEYDGSPLKTVDLVDAGKLNEEVSVVTKNEEGYGFVKNDRNSIRTTVNGSQTLPGSSKNSFNVTKVDAAIANNYIITTVEGDLVVKDRTDKYQVNLTANSAEKFYDGFALNVSGFVGYDDEIRVTFDGKDYIITGLEAEASQLDVIRDRNGNVLTTVVSVTGQAVVKNLAGDDLTEQFDVQTTNGTLKIKPRTVTLTSASAEKEYDGQPLTTKALVDKDELTEEVSATEYNATTGTGFVEGEGFTAIVTGSQTLVGVSDNTFNYELTDDTSAVNYNIDPVLGKLTVKDRTDKYQVTVKAKSGSKFYDGQKMTVQGFEAAYEGREFTETAKGIQFVENDATYYITGLSAKADATKVSRDADKNVIAVEVPVKTALIGGMHVKDANGNDVTAQFDVTTLNGELVINPRQVTVTSATDEKEYDATPLTNDEVTATAFNAETGKGFLTEDTVSYDVTGSQTIVGSSDNTFDIIWADKDEEINYDVTKELGTLTVINREAPYEITVVANSDEFLYDGTEQTVTGFKEVRFAQEDEEDLVFEATEDGLVFTIGNENFKVSGLTVNAATSTDVVEDKPVTITGTAVVTDAGNNDVTAQFAVHTENGTLNVTPRKVTLVAGSDEKDFDGKALVKRTYYVANAGDGFATYTKDGVTVNEKTGITVYVKGSQTLVGTSDNVIDRVEFDGQTAKAGNYIVTTEKGTLEVKTREPGNKIKVYIQLDIDQTGKNTKEVLYNGEEQSVSVDVIVNTDGTAEEIEIDDEENIEVEEDLTAPAEATEEAGILPVSKADETLLEKVLALGAMKVYAAEDGITKTVTYGGVTFEISGIKLSGGTGIDAGKYPVTIDLSGINVKLSGAPVDDNFEIVIVQPKITELVPAVQLGDAVYIDEDGNEVGGERQEEIVWVEQDVTLDPNVIGMLTIDPRNVTLIANSASGVATGQTLTANGYTVGTEDDGFVEGEEEGIKVTVEGAISTVGSVPNKITAYEFDEELAKAGNYIVHTVDGTLTLIAPATVNPPTGGGGGGGGDVLGARRGVEAITPEEGQVLGAARKSPKTSDANNAILWAMVMGSSALGMAAMMAQKRKKEEEQ